MMKPRMLPNDLVRAVSHLLGDLGTPYCLGVAAMLRSGDWDGISELNPDPRQYLDEGRYAKDAAAAAMLRKLQELPTTHNRRQNAIEKWWDGERKCYRTNERLGKYTPINRQTFEFGDRDARIESFVDSVRKIILSWIGAGPSELSQGRFGPGATFSDRGGMATIPDKMSNDPSLTPNAVWWLPQWLTTQWGTAFVQRSGELSFVRGNRFATVPKTSKTDRSIAAEPSINVFYQLALGRDLRRRLAKRAGWDLDRAQDIHRQIAEESSVTREFATLDLSNASDTVASTLVEVLLPQGWFSALNDLRSRYTLMDGHWVVLEKFSSMGNGFTFELETLLFAAVSCAVARESGYLGVLGQDVFVFGDDIIVKNDVAHPLKSVLEFLGFELNVEKSYFGDEPFRESCGADFFNGFPVRPYFLKELPSGPLDYFAFANGIHSLFDRLSRSNPRGSLSRRGWFSILDNIPSRLRRLRGPQVLGDIVIHDEPAYWTFRWRGQIRYLQCYRPHRYRVKRYERYSPEVVLACATYGCGNRQGGVIPRDGILSFKVGWIAYS